MLPSGSEQRKGEGEPCQGQSATLVRSIIRGICHQIRAAKMLIRRFGIQVPSRRWLQSPQLPGWLLRNDQSFVRSR